MVIAITIFRSPVKWLKFRPEKPMGEILEEGDKADGEKKDGGEGEGGAGKPTSTEKKEGVTEEPAVVNKEVLVGNHDSCNLLFSKISLPLPWKVFVWRPPTH